VKQAQSPHAYLIADMDGADESLFEGFECRWNEVPSPHGEDVVLLVRACSGDAAQDEATYGEILSMVADIYGAEARYHPLRQSGLSLAGDSRLLSVEAGVRRSFSSLPWRALYRFGSLLRRQFGNALMSGRVRRLGGDWRMYRSRLIANSDFKKLDDYLRMLIPGSRGKAISCATGCRATVSGG